MTLDDYQRRAAATAIYPPCAVLAEGRYSQAEWLYPALGLAGETGELIEHVKKVVRDANGKITDEARAGILHEAGDVLWYLAMTLRECDLSLEQAAEKNLSRLASRSLRSKLHGNGDAR